MIHRALPAAVLFDFNGVLVDDEGLHFELLRDILVEEGLPRISRREYDRLFLPLRDRECFERAFRGARRPLSARGLASLLRRKALRYRRRLTDVPLFPGAIGAVRALATRAPIGVVSGARRVEIEALLDRAGVLSLFGTIVAAEDCATGKPDAGPYRTALRRLGVRGAEALAVEDSPGGAESARRAGVAVLGVGHTVGRRAFGPIDLWLPSIRAFSVRWLERNWPPRD